MGRTKKSKDSKCDPKSAAAAPKKVTAALRWLETSEAAGFLRRRLKNGTIKFDDKPQDIWSAYPQFYKKYKLTQFRDAFRRAKKKLEAVAAEQNKKSKKKNAKKRKLEVADADDDPGEEDTLAGRERVDSSEDEDEDVMLSSSKKSARVKSEVDIKAEADEHHDEQVRFNVAGQMYEISRNIVMKYPETLLAKSVSETWQRDPSATVFINGDGDRFRYILDYLRTGRIFVPISISKDAILNDLDYYGFENYAAHVYSASVEAAAHMASKNKEFAQKVKSLQQEVSYRKIAHYCFKHYSDHGVLSKIQVAGVLKQLDSEKLEGLSNLDESLFNECLAEYGLYYINFKQKSKTKAYLSLGILSEQEK